jgi:hypothetical protein
MSRTDGSVAYRMDIRLVTVADVKDGLMFGGVVNTSAFPEVRLALLRLLIPV